MKKHFLLLSLVLIVTGAFLSCSDKESGGSNDTSKLQIYGRNYTIQSGVIWKGNNFNTVEQEPYEFHDVHFDPISEMDVDQTIVGYTSVGDVVNTGNFTLSLYEEGLVYNSDISVIKGKGALVCFHLSSKDLDQLTMGKYTFSTIKNPSTFIGYSSSFYDMDGSDEVPAVISEGELTIAKEGDLYRIKFDCKTSFGGVVSGEYYGAVGFENVERDESFADLKDITMTALLKVQNEGFSDGENTESYPGYDSKNTAFYSTSQAIEKTSWDEGADAVDLAVKYYEESNSIVFTSPIEMKSWLDVDNDMNSPYPCHTKYMLAPDTFTDSDFDKLDANSFIFDVKESTVAIPVDDTFKTTYIYFLTGNGVLGVIKVKSIAPSKVVHTDEWENTYSFYTAGPEMVIDIKVSANFANAQIR